MLSSVDASTWYLAALIHL